MRRVFRGVTYTISVRRIAKGNACRLLVDGQPVRGNIVPLPPAGTAAVEVSAELGVAVS